MTKVVSIMHWCEANWWLVSLIAYGLINVLNAVSRHWSEQRGLVKVLTFGTEALSVLTSKEAPTWLKLPGQVGKDAGLKGKVGVLLPLAAIGWLYSSGCASLPLQIDRADTAIAKASPALMGFFHARCTTEATKCGPVGSEKCPGWAKCDAVRTGINLALDAAQTAGLEAMTLSALGKATEAKAKLQIAVEALQRAYDAAKAAGVL